MSRNRNLTPWMMESVASINSKPNLRRLTHDERKQIASIAQFSPSDTEWDEIENCRESFSWLCWAEPQAIEFSPFARRLEMFADSVDTALTALGGQQPSHDGRTTRLSFDKVSMLMISELWPDEHSIASFIEKISMLQTWGSAARRAIKRTAGLPEKNPWRRNWLAFVDTLASIFEAHGREPTAASSSRARNPRPSVFVAFVEHMVDSLPADFRRHKQSPEAMSKAVARALKFRRSHKRLLAAGPKISAA
jgi:hypothetical protein